MPAIEINGEKVRYRAGADIGPDTGAERLSPGRPSLVCLHMAGGSSLSWLGVIRHLQGRLNVLAPDLPGHGQSEGPGGDTISAYADFALAFIRTLGLGRPWVAGHSMGGAIAMELAITHPDAVGGLVLLGTGARLKVAPMVFEAIRSNLSSFSRLLERVAFSPAVSKEKVSAHLGSLIQCDQETLLGDFTGCDRFDRIREVSEISVPTLVLTGEDDQLTPPKYARYLAERISGATLKLIPNCGHLIQLERPAELHRALDDFLT